MCDIKLKNDECGFPYSEQLPENFVLATPEDFFQNVSVKNWVGEHHHFEVALRLDFPFAVLSFHSGLYELYRVREYFDPDKLEPWFQENHVFIYRNN